MDDMINEEMVELADGSQSIITVVGVGGAGCNAVNYMWDVGIRNVRFIVCNTDKQSLDISPIQQKVRLGNGLGAGNDPEAGREAATQGIEEIRSRLEAMNTKMMFIAAGMGGGTGTGAAPVIAKLAREMGILTVAIVTSPLKVEGDLRYNQAMEGIELMKDSVDSLLIVNNENIQNLYLEDPSVKEAFSKANEILACAAKGIAEIITVKTSYVNVDFADVSRVIRNSGRAHMSVEKARGDNRAIEVARMSLSSPLLDHNHIAGAKNILMNVAVSNIDNFKYSELTKILNHIQDNARVTVSDGTDRTANIIWGMSEKPDLEDYLELVLVATGFDNEAEEFARYDRDKMLIQSGMGVETESGYRGGVYKAPEILEPIEKPIIDGEKIILPERAHRYPNIYSMLKVPAYIAHKVPMMSDNGASVTKRTPTSVAQEDEELNGAESNENSLFN